MIRDYQFRTCIWENLLTPWNFKAGKSTSRLTSSGASHVPRQPLTFPSPEQCLAADAGLPFDARNFTGTSGNVFERPPV